MRVLVALLLALSCGLGHSSSIACADEVYWTDSAAPKCPPRITNASIININQTGFTITGTGDANTAGSTHYAWISSTATFPPGCTSLNYTRAHLTSAVTATRQAAEIARQACMKWPFITDGTDATLTASSAVPSAGVFNLAVTGGACNTAYVVWHLHKGGVSGAGKVSVLSEHTVTTDATAGGDCPPATGGDQLVDDRAGDTLRASPRYISSVDGNDLDNGLTPATAWLTTNKNLCGLAPGTNIGLFNTSVFSTTRMTACAPGTAGDWNIIGSYKLNGSSEAVWITDGVRGGGAAAGGGSTDTKATFRGGLTDGCITNGTCTFATTGVFPTEGYSSKNQGTLMVTAAADYTEFRNILFEKGRFGTIVADGGGVDEGLHHLIFEGIDVRYSGYQNPIAILDGVSDFVVRNGSSYGAGICSNSRFALTSANTEACNTGSGWSGTYVVATRKARRGLIENNDIIRGFGEGINCYNSGTQDDGWLIITGNRVMNTHSTGIYLDGCPNSVVEKNIVVGGSGQMINVTNSAPTFECISVSSEDSTYTNGINNLIRNNLALGCRRGINGAMFAAVRAAGDRIGALVFGNTVIASHSSVDTQRDSLLLPAIDNVEEWVYKSNVSWNEALGASSCNSTSAGDYSHNHWYATQTDADCKDATTDTTGNPELAENVYSFWTALRAQNGATPTWPTFEDVIPDVGSPVIAEGYSAEAVDRIWASYGLAATQMSAYRSGAITPENWVKERHYDALDEVVGDTPPIGAVCPAAGCTDDPVVEPDPTALTISPNGKYFRRNGAPFSWVGCTGWLITDQTTADMTTFLEDQQTRGCNVVHGPIMNSIFDAVDDANGPISSTSPFTMRTSYFSTKVDHYMSEAARLGLVVAFPLAWGPNCKRDMVESATNARTYADFIVGRYASYANVVWIACGEYTKMSTNSPSYLANSDALDSNELAILDALIAGVNANKHVDALTTLHPDGYGSTTDTGRHPTRNFHTEGDLDFNVLQGYANLQENITDTEYDSQLSPQRPTLQMENMYEEQSGLPGGDSGAVAPWHVRNAAWGSRLSGSAGYTYGHGCVWYFCTGWAGQLADAGAGDIFTHFKSFWDTHHDEGLIRSRDWLTGDKGSNTLRSSTHTYMTALRSADGTKMIVYAPQGTTIHVVTNNLTGSVRARWFDPRNGGYTAISDPVTKSADTTFDPTGSPGVDNDWVLVLD